MRFWLVALIVLAGCATSVRPLRATDTVLDAGSAIEIGKSCDPSRGADTGSWSARLQGGKWRVRFDTPDCGSRCPLYAVDVDAATGAPGRCEIRTIAR